MARVDKMKINQLMPEIYPINLEVYKNLDLDLLRNIYDALIESFVNFTYVNYEEYLKDNKSEKYKKINQAYKKFMSKHKIYRKLMLKQVIKSHVTRLGLKDSGKNIENSMLKAFENFVGEEDIKEQLKKEIDFWYVSEVFMYIYFIEETHEDIPKKDKCYCCCSKLLDTHIEYKTSFGTILPLNLSCALNLGLDFVTNDNITSEEIIHFLDENNLEIKNISKHYKKMLPLGV